MEAITIDVEEDGTVRLPKSFVAAEPGERVVVRRDAEGKIELLPVPKISFHEWVSRFEIDETMTLERAMQEGQEEAPREAVRLSES
jgi:hypothetical protein